MSKINLGLSHRNVAETLALAATAKTGFTGNANFPTTNPTVATLTTDAAALQAADNAYKAWQGQGPALLIARDNAQAKVAQDLTMMVMGATATVLGDATKLATIGLPLVGAHSPTGTPGMVTNLSAASGDFPGEVDLNWDPVLNALTYNVRVSPDPITPTSWAHYESLAPSKIAVKGLTPGTRYWFDVSAVGTKGTKGAPSDPATKIAP